jgi:hypothetical protein
LALELLFQAGVGLGPKRFETARHLDRTVAWGQDMEGERMAAECDFDVVCDSVKILDSGREKRIRRLGISHLRSSPTWKLDSLGSVFFDELLLLPSEE